MLLAARQGNYLTESFDVPFSERRFVELVTLSSSDEAKYWKEITEQEKAAIIAQGQLFDVENVSYEYLTKVDTLLAGIADKINGANLGADEALQMKRYFPHWEDKMGEDVVAGFRMQRGEYLFEVVVPHRVSAETDPLMQVSTLPAEDTGQGYYKLVKSEKELYNE